MELISATHITVRTTENSSPTYNQSFAVLMETPSVLCDAGVKIINMQVFMKSVCLKGLRQPDY